MKKLMNSVERVIPDALQGIELAYPHLLKVQYAPDVVVRVDAPVAGKVALLSGGGSGHEPLHTGFVGKGMLDAACPGAIFTSPVPDQMLAAARAVDGGAGMLFIIKNYTGDVMNFEMAAELAEADGIEVASIIVNDDVAVKDSLYTAGRRGVGTTVLLEKIVGGAAEQGASLAECARIAARVNDQGRSMGMALTSCVVPAKGSPTFELGEDEMEIGIGIHGEPGRERMPIQPASEIVDILATAILEDGLFQAGDAVLAFVNGMGGTPLLELAIVYKELVRVCQQRDIRITRNLIGNYITSLDMAGCSITLLKLDDELTTLWDAPVHTPALRWGV